VERPHRHLSSEARALSKPRIKADFFRSFSKPCPSRSAF
jgi:hypothetical protein